MGTTEQQYHGATDVITAPLLPSSETPPRRNMFAFVCATLASMTTILMGYNLALMSRAELFMREDLGLTDEQVEVLSGSMNLFMLVSILAAGWAADSIGRRGTVVVANAFLMAGTLAMSLGGGYAALLAARFVTSVGVGFSVVVAPVYAAEIAPASSRGLLSSLVDFFITGGILLRYVSNYALAGLPLRLGWRVMFALGVPPPPLLAAGVLAMPESPRWLTTSDTPAEAHARLEEIAQAVAAQVGGAGVWGVRGSCSPGRRRWCAGSSPTSSCSTPSSRPPASTPEIWWIGGNACQSLLESFPPAIGAGTNVR